MKLIHQTKNKEIRIYQHDFFGPIAISKPYISIDLCIKYGRKFNVRFCANDLSKAVIKFMSDYYSVRRIPHPTHRNITEIPQYAMDEFNLSIPFQKELMVFQQQLKQRL